MKRTTALIIGAGQCGLSMSNALSKRGIDHLVLDAGRIGNSWKTERWDSLRMLTPNWMNVLPGTTCDPAEADGFMPAAEMGTVLDDYAAKIAAPVLQETRVETLYSYGEGYLAATTSGPIAADNIVIASGNCARPNVPGFASEIPEGIAQVSPIKYKTPNDLPDGPVLVVGASASGLNISRELLHAGRKVSIAVGEHLRLPRRYRGRDICEWMHDLAVFDELWCDVDDLTRVRRLPSLPLIGGTDISLNTLQDMGAELHGRLSAITDGTAWFSGGLGQKCMSADLKMKRLLRRIDERIDEHGLDATSGEPFEPTRLPASPRLKVNISDYAAIVWATGYRPDHSWLDMPVFDRKGRLKHDGGIVGNGIYALGLSHLRTARSTHVDGAGRDAEALADDLALRLGHALAA